MNEKKEINVLAKRLYQFRNEIGISTNGLSKIVGISQSTLSRIEKGTTRVLYANVQILAKAFGVSIIEFQNENILVPPRKKLVTSLKHYVKENNRDVDVNSLLGGANTAYFLDLYISKGFLSDFQGVMAIRNGIKEEFGVELKGSDITNLLVKRIDKGGVKKRDGVRTNTYEYKSSI